MSNSLFGISLALVSTMSWAICSILFKKLGEKLDAISIATIKATLSSTILFLIIFLTGVNPIIPNNQLMPIALSGIIGIAIGDSLFFAALNKLSPLALSVILLVCPDLFSGIFGVLFLNEIPSLLSWFGIFSIIIGIIFIFKEEKSCSKANTKAIGILFAIISLICTSYSMVIIKPILVQIPVIVATMYRMLFGGIVLMLLNIFTGRILSWRKKLNNHKYNLKLTGVIFLVTIGGFWMSLAAIKYCKLIIASSLMMLEPLFILIFMILFNKYKPNIKEIIGTVIIIAGIFLICFG